MTGGRVERRLAAVLAADVAGYSRLMGADEVGTLEALKAVRREVFDPAIAAHKGRIVKTTGDGILAEFGSSVDALTCAISVQDSMAERQVDVEPTIKFRIGINIGDIVIDGDDIFGDGVNIAARVENECEPGSVCLSGSAFEQVRGKTAFVFDDLGERSLKNIERPIRLYLARTASANTSGKRSAENATPLDLPDRPSIAVLPFQNMSGDAEQEYFADGMVEDIITALSRVKSFFVIARNSSFTYKGKAVDIKQVGRELGVRYVLEGSVRKAGGRVRITGQLIEASTGHHVWADRFDGNLDEVFDLQDRITEHVVAAIEPNLQFAEIERLRRRATTSLNAYDHLLHAQQFEYQFTDGSLIAAIQHCKKAIDIDPTYAPAMALAAYCYGERRFQGWTKDIPHETQEGLQFAEQALEHGKFDPNVLWMCALATWQLGLDIKRAQELAQRSLETNPNSAIACTIAGWIEAYSGHYSAGKELLGRAQRLSPRDPRAWFAASGMAIAHLGEGNFEEGAAWASKALAQNPRYTVAMRLLAANLANLGNIEAASVAVAQFLRIEPDLTIEKLRARLIFMNPGLWSNLTRGLRLGGLT